MCWSCFNKGRRTNAATRNAYNVEVSSKEVFNNVNAFLVIVRRRKFMVKTGASAADVYNKTVSEATI